jgi:E3 ubiquitin-protein ligase TRIP12
MLDASYASDGEHCEISDTENNKDQAVEEPQGEDDENSDDGNGEGDNNEDGNAPRGDEEAQNIYGLLGGDFAQLGAFLSNISSRLKSLLANIKQRNDPTARVIALQELSELLSVSNEDTLHSFSVDSFVTELVKIMGGTGRIIDDDDSDRDSDDGEPKDPDAVLAAALAAGEEGIGEDIPEAQLLACRCLANLMEAIPGSAHTVVYHGAIPVLCSKLINIMDIDLAEQTLSVSFPSCRMS